MAAKKKKKSTKTAKAAKRSSIVRRGSIAERVIDSTRGMMPRPSTIMNKLRSLAPERPERPERTTRSDYGTRREQAYDDAPQERLVGRSRRELPRDVQRLMDKGHSLEEIEEFERVGRRSRGAATLPPVHEQHASFGARDAVDHITIEETDRGFKVKVKYRHIEALRNDGDEDALRMLRNVFDSFDLAHDAGQAMFRNATASA